ncbi:MAG TPA: sigma-70 family RNA polymerase sigma factor [Acidimicrobiia bacterium]|nr:sigma-70 family RNA polymerase sigma factor [Acidimicrobiia bacterium]
MPSLSTPPRDIDSGHKFESLFADHYLAVYRYCLRRLGPADSEDAAAEVFAVAWRRLEQVPTGEPVRSWLLAVAYRVVGNHYRGRRRRVRLSDRLRSEREQVVEPEVSDPEVRLLRRALDSLRSDDRELLRLSAWDGLSNAEIATVIGVKQNAVDQRLFRARERLRGRVELLSRETPEANARKAAT